MGIERIVTKEDFVSRYKEGSESWKEYKQILKLHSKGLNPNQIAKRTKISHMTVRQRLGVTNPQSVLGLERPDGMKPQCVRGLERAIELGIVPLYRTTPKLIPMSRLYSWAFWSGCVGKDYKVSIYSELEPLHWLRAYFQRKLGLKGQIISHNGTGLRFDDVGRICGRVLACMGYPVGRKSEQELHIPKAITNSRRTSLDFLRALFASHTRGEAYNYQIVYLLTSKSSEVAKSFGQEVVALIQKTFPETNVTEENLFVRKGKEGYIPTINLRKDNLLSFAEHYPAFFCIQPRKLWYTDHQS